jgi:hypothetical protein
MTVIAGALPPEVAALRVLEVSGDELLAEFAAVMHEWGHARTAERLRFPTRSEARCAAAGRDETRGRNRNPDGTWNPIP